MRFKRIQFLLSLVIFTSGAFASDNPLTAQPQVATQPSAAAAETRVSLAQPAPSPSREPTVTHYSAQLQPLNTAAQPSDKDNAYRHHPQTGQQPPNTAAKAQEPALQPIEEWQRAHAVVDTASTQTTPQSATAPSQTVTTHTDAQQGLPQPSETTTHSASAAQPAATPTQQPQHIATTVQPQQPTSQAQAITQAPSASTTHAIGSNHEQAAAAHTAPHTSKPLAVQDVSPWEQFLIQTIAILHYAQDNIQHYFSVLLSKQGIPLLIITFGFLLLNIVIWFAYVSFKREQASRLKNLTQSKSTAEPSGDKPAPLALAYAEESSGDFDVFATSEGIPIKLDLAQAYINMGDIDGAKVVLEDIISQHRGTIVRTAQDLLKKISTT